MAQGGSDGGGSWGSVLYGALASAGTTILRADSCHQVFVTLARELTGPGAFEMACVAVPDPSARGGLTIVAHGGAVPRATALVVASDPGGIDVDHPMVAQAIAEGVAVHRCGPEGSAQVVPLRRDDEIVAVLCTSMADPDAYDDERLHLLDRLVLEVSVALRSIASREAEVDSRLARSAVQAELVARAHMHAAVARLGQRAGDTESIDDLLVDVAETVRNLLNLDSVIVEALLPDSSPGPCAVAGAGVARSVVGSGLGDRNSLGARLRADGGPFVVSDLLPLVPACGLPADPRARSVAAVIIGSPEEVRGAIVACGHVPRRFAADQIDFLQSLAGLVSVALERRQVAERLLAHAFQDELTGLPNRSYLYDRLEAAAAELAPGRCLAVLLVDLDGFKLVNEAYGHDVGDRLLVGVAGRLAEAVRGDDVVARLGGDEFGVLCVDLPDRASANDVAERLAAAIAAPFDLGTCETFITASVGITLHEGPLMPSRGLLGEADAAMYVAKESGRAGFEVFDDQMRLSALRRLEMTNDLRRALVDGELELVWHPIVELLPVSGERARLTLEALVRWRHPHLGLIRPDAFIGLAEDTGLIRPLGDWVLEAAAGQAAQWRRDDPAASPDLISVNLSAHQLARQGIVESIDRTFGDAGVDPTTVELELTETAFMSEPWRTVPRLRELTDLGFVISIDDFGTGYSSMSYLRELPASALKIDRSFVARLGTDRRDDAIVEAIIGLAHAVGLTAVAEGVETDEQLAAVQAMGCDRAQGFWWTEPLGPADVPAWIRTHRAAL